MDILKPLVEEQESRDARLVRVLSVLFDVDETDLLHAVSMHLSKTGLSACFHAGSAREHSFPWPVDTPQGLIEVLAARGVLPLDWGESPHRAWICPCTASNSTANCGDCGGSEYLSSPPTAGHLLGLLGHDWSLLETLVREATALHFPGASTPMLAWGMSVWSANVAYRASQPLVQSTCEAAARQAAHRRLAAVRSAGVLCARLTMGSADLYFAPDRRLIF